MRATPDLDELYAAAYGRLVMQLFAICGDLADAEDAVQEAFVTAVRKRRELEAVDNPVAWVRTVAVNRLRSGWRHRAVVRKYHAAVPGPQTDPGVLSDHVAIVTALSRLDPSQREVVVLHHLADLSTAEIAAELGIPEGTVKLRLSRPSAGVDPDIYPLGRTRNGGSTHVQSTAPTVVAGHARRRLM